MTNEREMGTVIAMRTTEGRGSMDPTQQMLVNSHIAALQAEATAERLALAGRANDPRPSMRAALGRGLIAIGTAIAAKPVEEPCPDTGAGTPA